VLRRTGYRARTTSLADFGAEFDVWFEASALPLWWAMGADHTHGGFFGALDQRGRAVAMQKRFRVQARQTFVYATAGAAGWQGPWKDAVAHGARFMRESHLREDGLYRGGAADASGRDDAMTLYDQAFALLAYSAIERALPGETDARAAAAWVSETLTASHIHPLGGFDETEMHGSRLQSNPHMHLLEACLAWAALPDGARWKELGGRIVTLCARHFIDQETGAVGEFFADDGRPAAGAAGTLVDGGHQFEWAYLLTQASQTLNHSGAATLAKRLYEIGNRHGVDRARGVAIDELSDDLSVRSARARLWPQTERLKASLAFARLASGDAREGFERDAEAAARGLHFYFDTPVKGLWRDKMRPDGTFVNEPAPATSFYHIACAILELRKYLTERG
jgi:mannose-6-phosphate isomerase